MENHHVLAHCTVTLELLGVALFLARLVLCGQR